MERTCKIRKMVDRISNLPDPILCHILSFLPTKEAVATSLVSKRWKPLWRSVPALDIDYNDNSENGENYYRLVRFVYAFILSRDLYHPIQRFRLWFFPSYISSIYDASLTNVKIWVEAAMQRRVEHLDFRWFDIETTSLSAIFSCKTLVVLKLMSTDVKAFSSVELPSLKVMHLKNVRFLELEYLAELLSGCPQLEDLKAINLEFDNNFTEREFKTLPKLVRADISWVHYFLLRVVSNVECLHIDGMSGLYRLEDFDIVKKLCCKDSSAVFHNLTYIQFNAMNHKKDWVAAVEVLKYCPKLRVLVINKLDGHSIWGDEEEREDWVCPQSDVECIPLHLKSCTLYNYKGSKTEFQFARYIMQNARYLQTIKIHCVTDSPWRKFSMIQELSLCTRRSATCELSFEL